MPVELEIDDPIIRILNSEPSSLGTVDYCMVLFDEIDEEDFEAQTADWRAEENLGESRYPFFLLHTTNTKGQTIKPLHEEGSALPGWEKMVCPLPGLDPRIYEDSQEFPYLYKSPEEIENLYRFSIYLINAGPMLNYHCVVCRTVANEVWLKSGMHYSDVSSRQAREQCGKLPQDWDAMENMNGEVHVIAKLKRERFWPMYDEALKEWNQRVKPINSRS